MLVIFLSSSSQARFSLQVHLQMQETNTLSKELNEKERQHKCSCVPHTGSVHLYTASWQPLPSLGVMFIPSLPLSLRNEQNNSKGEFVRHQEEPLRRPRPLPCCRGVNPGGLSLGTCTASAHWCPTSTCSVLCRSARPGAQV